MRDNFKNAEGHASIKARMRAMQRGMARNRMIADMGDAVVVITNPTYISLALKYDPMRGIAPRVLAVGAGSLAARIRERAQEESATRCRRSSRSRCFGRRAVVRRWLGRSLCKNGAP